MKYAAMFLLGLFQCMALARGETNAHPETLTSKAGAVVAVEITSTDYTATAHDGDMVAEARVLKGLKGPVKEGECIMFSETAWVGPDYQTGESRVLFLERGGSSDEAHATGWRILSDLRAKSAFLVESNAVPDLTLESLEAVLANPRNAGTNGLRIVIMQDE